MLPGFSVEPSQQERVHERFSCTAFRDLPGAGEIEFHFRYPKANKTDKHVSLHWSWIHHELLPHSGFFLTAIPSSPCLRTGG
jgi:hypothetical protein